jgi:iron(III) transport system permease protein
VSAPGTAIAQWPRRAWRRRPSPSLAVLCAIALVLFVWPVVMVIYGAFRSDAPGNPSHWSTKSLTDAFSSGHLYHSLLNSVALTAAIITLGTALALYFAWLVARTATPLRRLVAPMMLIVFAIPPLFFALSWVLLGQQPAGTLNKAFQLVTGSDAAPVDVQSWYGMVAVAVMKVTAAEFLLLIGPFLALDSSFAEAARVAGSGRLRTLLRIELPMLAPSIIGVVILGFIVGLSLLDLPLVLGVPAGISVLPTEIYTYITGHDPPDYAGASSIAMLLVAIVLLLVAVQWRILGNRQFVTVTGKGHRREPMDIGRWKYLGTAMIVLYGLIALVLPLAQFVVGSLQPYFGVYQHLTLDNYRAVFDTPDLVNAFKNTLVVGLVSGFVASAMAVWISIARQRGRSPLRRLPDLAVWLLVAIPGITLGLGVVWAYLSVPGLKSLYATTWILVIALAAGGAPIATRAVGGAVGQIGRELEEAARVAGASNLRATVGIVVRLVLPSFFAAWFLTFVLAAGNLDIPILLSSTSNATVPTIAFESFAQGRTAQAAATFCVLLLSIVAIVALAAIVSYVERRIRLRPRRVPTLATGGA